MEIRDLVEVKMLRGGAGAGGWGRAEKISKAERWYKRLTEGGILLFLDLSLPLRTEDHSEFHSKPEAFGHMSPYYQSVQVENFYAQVA